MPHVHGILCAPSPSKAAKRERERERERAVAIAARRTHVLGFKGSWPMQNSYPSKTYEYEKDRHTVMDEARQ